MKILIINYHHLASNSGVHIFNLANQLVMLGANCVVCVPFRKDLTASLGTALFDTVEFSDITNNPEESTFDLVHAWTPREAVRIMTNSLLARHRRPYVVHMEDNEEYLTQSLLGISSDFLRIIPNTIMDMFISPGLSHPRRYKDFLAKAGGVTVIMDSLKEFCPPGVPTQVISAGYEKDMNWSSPPNLDYKHSLGILEDEFILVYTGNVHKANSKEVSDLYRSVEIVNEHGFRLKLIRTGVDHAPLLLNNLETIRKNFCIELGYIPRESLPPLLSIADILVQPGIPGRFNDYRFPSKIPEYLASGKPVILPKTNIGLYLKDRVECVLLERGDAADIAEKMELLLSNANLRSQIGIGGRLFAEQNLQWNSIAAQMYSFYETLLRS